MQIKRCATKNFRFESVFTVNLIFHVFFHSESNYGSCYRCMMIYEKHPNVIQYKESKWKCNNCSNREFRVCPFCQLGEFQKTKWSFHFRRFPRSNSGKKERCAFMKTEVAKKRGICTFNFFFNGSFLLKLFTKNK